MRVAKLTAALLTANLAIGTLGTSALKAETDAGRSVQSG